MEWASCPLSIFLWNGHLARYQDFPFPILSVSNDSRFPIPDSPLPSLNRKPQLGATLCSRFLAGVSQKESHFSKKSYKGKRSVACQVEDPVVARVSRQLRRANRPPIADKKDF
ncbi:hypothetical protein [Moorena sp. SIO4G3]|uniref:hypothetical protein n=1 Tax=Moorena sp. SIO4G3 TaxID=2607821 RepID=UPI00142BED7F|nr:hypothetical protein [Moorena sp. SIO4G3]NEO80697.1 hypothetical protein [Moorena sp. SIO4G3]